MNIYDYIKSKYLRLSKGQRKVAQFILEKPSAISSNIASEVGRLAGVSESTVIRFCYAIELSGYGELQEKINDYLTLDQTLSTPTIEKKVTSDEVKGFMLQHAKQISEVIQRIDSKQIMCAINQIKNAQLTYVVGLNENKLLATILCDGIYSSIKVEDLENVYTMLEKLMKEDVIILLDDSKHPKYVEHIILAAEKANVNVVFIHEKKTHPLRKKCAVNLCLGESQMMSSFGAYSLASSLVNALSNTSSLDQKELVNM